VSFLTPLPGRPAVLVFDNVNVIAKEAADKLGFVAPLRCEEIAVGHLKRIELLKLLQRTHLGREAPFTGDTVSELLTKLRKIDREGQRKLEFYGPAFSH